MCQAVIMHYWGMEQLPKVLCWSLHAANPGLPPPDATLFQLHGFINVFK